MFCLYGHLVAVFVGFRRAITQHYGSRRQICTIAPAAPCGQPRPPGCMALMALTGTSCLGLTYKIGPSSSRQFAAARQTSASEASAMRSTGPCPARQSAS